MSVNVSEDKVNRKMHELFMQVLKNRDLSRAGDLFSVPDTVIVNDLTNVVRKLFISFYANILIILFFKHSIEFKNNSDNLYWHFLILKTTVYKSYLYIHKMLTVNKRRG